MIEKVIAGFAAALSRPSGFVTTITLVVLGTVICTVFRFSETAQLVFNLILSIAAIVMTGAVLVSQDRDSCALHKKLDELIRTSDSRNDLIGLEQKTKAEIENSNAFAQNERML